MVITLKTKNQTLQKIFGTPMVGAIVVFLIALAPVPLLFILNHIFNFTENIFIERINALITGLWNLVLFLKFEINIGVLFIPCWLLFTVIGILRCFQVID